jgi:hypothetical protein
MNLRRVIVDLIFIRGFLLFCVAGSANAIDTAFQAKLEKEEAT